jgi:hypothetical protein
VAKRTEKPKPTFYVKVRYGQGKSLANWSIPSGHATFKDALDEVNALIRTRIQQTDYLDVRIGKVPALKL